jgi:hypothetical protein
MVSNRCKISRIKKLGLHFIVVDLGEVDVMENITSTQREQLKAGLLSSGLIIKIHAHRKIKNVIIQMVHHSDEVLK